MSFEKHAKATLAYGTLLFSMDLPAKRIKGHPPAFRGTDLRILENAAASWIIEHGATQPETIRALRAAAGLTATELADLLGVSKSRVSEWEHGKHDPGVGTWMTVASLAMEKLGRKAPMRARLLAVKAYEANPIVGEIRLTA